MFFCESTFALRTFPGKHVAFQVFFSKADLRTKNLPIKPCGISCFFVSRPSHHEPSQKTMWRFKFLLWVNLRTKEPSSENHAMFQVFFVSRPSHQESSHKTMWHFNFFCESTFAPKKLPRKPCGVSSLFCESTFAPKNFPIQPCGVSSFLCESTFAPKNLPRKPCGVSSLFCESTFAPKPSQKTMWRFKFFFVSRPSHQRTFPKNHVAFQFFCESTFAPKNLPRKPCGVSSFFCESTFAPKNIPRKPCGVSSLFFLCVNLRTKTFPENHVAFQVFFCHSTFAQRIFP